MALRPIDNALPITPERPKKQAKVSAPIQKQAEFGVNDENKVPLPPSADAVIDYISSENLKAIPDPESKIQVSLIQLYHVGLPGFTIDFSFDWLFCFDSLNFQGLIEGLDSKDWTKVCESLNNARRFALHHTSLLLPILYASFLTEYGHG